MKSDAISGWLKCAISGVVGSRAAVDHRGFGPTSPTGSFQLAWYGEADATTDFTSATPHLNRLNSLLICRKLVMQTNAPRSQFYG